MLAATNWTAIAASGVTGVTAIVVGLFGLLGTKLTARTASRQIEFEDRRAERERGDAARNERRRLYATFLGREREFHALKTWSGDEVVQHLLKALDPLNEIMLAGTGRVATAATRLYNAATDFLDEWDEHPPADETEGDQRAEHWFDERKKMRRDLIDAMREDVSPDAEAIKWSGVTG